jgi:hypothetical protein
MTFSTTTGNDPQLDLFEPGSEAKSEPEAEAEELKYKSNPQAFFNGRIWTIPEDVPF